MDTEFWLPLAYILFLAGGWLVVTCALSYISGWAFLARRYRAQQPFGGRFERVRSSQMGAAWCSLPSFLPLPRGVRTWS